MKNSPNPKSQSKSLKKEIRAGGSACENSKSMQKRTIYPFHLINNLALSHESTSNQAFFDLQNRQNDRDNQEKHKRKVSKENDLKKRPVTAGTTKKVKNFIGSKLQKRLQSYYLFLALARQSLCAPTSKPLTEDRKYVVYVGKGNNSKLVKKLFYSRHWWTVTNDPKQQNINLIWTQWSKKSIFSQLQQAQDQERLKNATCKIICTEQSKKNMSINQYNSLLKSKQREFSKPCFIQTQTDVKHYLNCNKNSRKKKHISLTCNHVEGHEAITDKKNLLYCLQQYCNDKKQNCFDITPLSFHIKGSEEEFKTLQQLEKELNSEEKERKKMWITKPGEKSNRGNGIKIFKKIEEIKEHIEKQAEKYPSRTYIVQQYLYPALFHRRKFDIRCFVLLVASPSISAYFFNDGYLRTSCKQFKDRKIDDKFMHLTNDAIQKKANDYGKFEKGNKVTFEEYQKYLDMFQRREINFKKQILPKLKVMAAKSIAAGCSSFNQSKRAYSFQLLGYDFIIDENYKPWLIEVNTNPCIQTGCPVLSNFIPSALNNAFKIAIDSVFRPPKVNDWHLQQVITFSQKILENNRYELIFQESVADDEKQKF